MRCKSYYRKELEVCPACSGLNDEVLASALKERREFRVSLGKNNDDWGSDLLYRCIGFRKTTGIAMNKIYNKHFKQVLRTSAPLCINGRYEDESY